MSVIDTLITDRTAADAAKVAALKEKIISRTATQEELTEWATELKGAYSPTDFNRVEAAVAYLISPLAAVGYDTLDLTTKTDWATNDVPSAEQTSRYISNITAIKNCNMSGKTIPSSMNALTWQGANQIEEMLYDTYDATSRIAHSVIYSGQINSGGASL